MERWHKKKIKSERKYFFLWKMSEKVWLKEEEEEEGGLDGRRRRLRSLCWCDGSLALGWSSDGEHTLRTRLDDWSPS